MLLSSDARGVFPIAPTPFFDDGRIDTASIDRLVDFYRECGCTGLTVLGQLGEAPKLEHAESVDIAARAVRRAAGRRWWWACRRRVLRRCVRWRAKSWSTALPA